MQGLLDRSLYGAAGQPGCVSFSRSPLLCAFWRLRRGKLAIHGDRSGCWVELPGNLNSTLGSQMSTPRLWSLSCRPQPASPLSLSAPALISRRLCCKCAARRLRPSAVSGAVSARGRADGQDGGLKEDVGGPPVFCCIALAK